MVVALAIIFVTSMHKVIFLIEQGGVSLTLVATNDSYHYLCGCCYSSHIF